MSTIQMLLINKIGEVLTLFNRCIPHKSLDKSVHI